MGFFDEKENVEEYIRAAEGHDGAHLIDQLVKWAPRGARVLELGMGPGKDLELLADAGFEPTGSDYSEVFVDRYKSSAGRFAVHHLDARTLRIDETFDVIYSNKVLHSLTEEELSTSFARQAELLNPRGVLFHSFWRGEGNEVFRGMFVQYYERGSLSSLLPEGFRLSAFELYEEMEPADSFWVALTRA